MGEPYDLRLAPAATRTIQNTLPEAVAAAVIEFVTGSLVANPRRVGKPLARELRGRYSARRGAFRIIYAIDDADMLVTVLRVEHRADVYRPR
ncbi:type II toxin-antitoxin system RelE family toxin [Pseudonocardia hydrocarbonoxydans]|uniref:Toxin RelG n=1 Tax=Pseudonocardia hydrocarbonoxydans TaxID=76726 RepID=A0A4Y3WTG0_9PSEU|nr:type II toxin-antitoxin system RelE/ParE family toxin [Pseudonocardia hydrocarbonoxydans]GEC22054.1 toxin RelG [Pseudonocardia hydrocarbonoxydans]